MKEKQNKKGFTLAELLIVVAIIGVLVAISIPIFNNQLRKARMATNHANARAGYAAVVAEYISMGAPQPVDGWAFTYDVTTGKVIAYENYTRNTTIPRGGLGAYIWLNNIGTPSIESWPDYPSDTKDIESFYRQIMKRWSFVLKSDGSINYIYYSQVR